VSAEEFKRRRDIIEKGKAANLKLDQNQLKKRATTSTEQINQLKKAKNVGQLSFAEEMEEVGKLCN